MKKLPLILLILFVFSISTSFSAEGKATGSITGKILLKNGEVLSNGKVYFFKEGSGAPPSQHKYWRTPDEIFEMDAEGQFTAHLAEGRYFLSAIKKVSKDLIGPPIDGDLVYPDSRKDLRQEQAIYSVVRNKVTDIGVIAEAVVFKKKARSAEESITGIEGTMVDVNGKPVADAIAFAFLTSKVTGKPAFVSKRTGSDGKYLLKVSAGGTYFLKLRTTLKGSHPEPGEIIGVFGKDHPAPITLKTGEVLRGINVVGKTFTALDKGNRHDFNYRDSKGTSKEQPIFQSL